jgi:hypothetical protein
VRPKVSWTCVQISSVFVFYLLLFRLMHYRIHSVTKNTSRLSISILQLEASNFHCPQREVPTFTRQSITVLLDESNHITLWCGCRTILLKTNIVLVNNGRGCDVLWLYEQEEALRKGPLMNFIGDIWFRMVPVAFPSLPERSMYHNTNSHLISSPNTCYFETWMFSFSPLGQRESAGILWAGYF